MAKYVRLYINAQNVNIIEIIDGDRRLKLSGQFDYSASDPVQVTVTEVNPNFHHDADLLGKTVTIELDVANNDYDILNAGDGEAVG